jgi:hypothetical protein
MATGNTSVKRVFRPLGEDQQAWKNRNYMATKVDDQTASDVRAYCKAHNLSFSSFLKLTISSFFKHGL